MTVTTIYEPATYTGDGSTTEFALSHQVKQSSHLSITIDGVSTSAWSATGYGNNSGVTVTFDSAPSNGSSIVIKRIVPYTQDTDLENFDGNPADVTESQFDLLAMADQQIVELSNRAVVLPLGASVSSKEISGTITSSSKILTVNSDGPALSELSGISTSLDAVFTGLISDDLIQYNGTNWVNITVADLGLVDSSENNTFTGDNIFQGVVDVTNVNAEGSGGGHLRTNGGTNCLSWGGGGSANLTADGNLSMNTTHKIVNCADPTSAQDVATKNYVDNNVPTDNGWQLISTVTASTSTTVDFTSGIDNTYDVYKITVADIDPSSDAALEMFFSTDGGSSYISSSYFYSQEVIKANAATGNFRSNSSSRIVIAGDLLNWGGHSNEGLSGEIMIYAPSGSTQYKKATFFITGSDTAANTQCCVGTCGWYGTTAINAIRLNMSAGIFASGNFALYGLKK